MKPYTERNSPLGAATCAAARLLRSLLVLGAGLAVATAQAGLPLQTEDAGVLAPRDCEFEAAVLHLREGGASERENALSLACGVGADSQLGLGYSRLRAGDERGRALGLGGKIALWRGEDGAAVALAVSSVWEHSEGGWRHAVLGLNAAYSGPMAAGLTMHLNLGHGQNRIDGERSTTWAAALEHEGLALGGMTLAPMGEIFGNDRDAPWWSGGLRLTLLPDRLYAGLSYGRQINAERARQVTASLKLEF